ncbi:MAG: (2Fe-2S)-binding protein [Leptospiraceae bacterium]|nr:(2Fe-2S)-binding protein [Leptospiraceae bacterium]
MIVCVCRAINDHSIKAAIHDGCSSRESLKYTIGAGAECGSCHHEIDKILHKELKSVAPRGFQESFQPA